MLYRFELEETGMSFLKSSGSITYDREQLHDIIEYLNKNMTNPWMVDDRLEGICYLTEEGMKEFGHCFKYMAYQWRRSGYHPKFITVSNVPNIRYYDRHQVVACRN